ncbi:MAG: CRP-like cAMP-binding protein/rhodanese-related sulfurtransferase [Sulfitobacter sp.]
MIITSEMLGRFSPFQLLTANALEEACRSATLTNAPKGKVVFKREDTREACWWLLSGSIDLVNAEFQTTQQDSDAPNNCRCLEEAEHYQHTAIATVDCLMISMDQDTLDLIMTVDQATDDDSSDDDWMTRLLSSRLFDFVPPANIQALFQNFSPINFNEGDEVIRQGATGDYFYVIKQGQASIDHNTDEQHEHLKKIGPGASFGEDALISDKKRNATVTMLTPGILMRLGKEQFNDLLVKPASEYVTLDEVRNVIAGGEQKISLIDVRHPSEIEVEIVAGTENIPLQLLRSHFAKMDQETVYVVATPGRRAELGSLLLTQAGFDSYILQHQ